MRIRNFLNFDKWKEFYINSSLSKYLSDETYLKFKYKLIFKKKLNLDAPLTFNEKLQWLKLHNRNPLYTTLVDKYKVKEHITNVLGEEYIIPTIGVWDSPEDIDFDSLPGRFVLKCNHNSGLGMCICRDKLKLDIEKVRTDLAKGIKEDYYLKGREWPYKNVARKIIAEEYKEDSKGEFNDYKFFCFDGVVDCVMVVTDRGKNNAKFYYFNEEWKILPYGRLTRSLPKDFTLPKPKNLDKMFELARILSKGFPHVRIDLYNVDGNIFFGEYTFYSQSGFEDGFDYETDKHLGNQILLQNRTKEKK